MKVLGRYIDAKAWHVVITRSGDVVRHTRFTKQADADAFAGPHKVEEIVSVGTSGAAVIGCECGWSHRAEAPNARVKARQAFKAHADEFADTGKTVNEVADESYLCANCGHWNHGHGRFYAGSGGYSQHCRSRGCSCPAPVVD